ncbi:MAG TPA: hypothetical protein VJ770_00480 [Stellaceae bacterium]|nr:hypothetical protein [Stellaceae bacterium]
MTVCYDYFTNMAEFIGLHQAEERVKAQSLFELSWRNAARSQKLAEKRSVFRQYYGYDENSNRLSGVAPRRGKVRCPACAENEQAMTTTARSASPG